MSDELPDVLNQIDIEAAAKKVARFEFASFWPELSPHQWQIAHERATIYVKAALRIDPPENL